LSGKRVILFDTLMGRVILFSSMFLSFYFVSATIGIDQAFLVLLPPFIVLTAFCYWKQGIKNILSVRSVLFSSLFVVLSLAIILVFSPNKLNEWCTIVIRQGLREELYFRFCMLGILKSSNDWKKTKTIQRALILFVNSMLFTLLHVQYQAISDYLTLLWVSLIFSYLFIENGIVSAIVAHSVWNFYLNWYLLIPLLVLAMVEKLLRDIPREPINLS